MKSNKPTISSPTRYHDLKEDKRFGPKSSTGHVEYGYLNRQSFPTRPEVFLKHFQLLKITFTLAEMKESLYLIS